MGKGQVAERVKVLSSRCPGTNGEKPHKPVHFSKFHWWFVLCG